MTILRDTDLNARLNVSASDIVSWPSGRPATVDDWQDYKSPIQPCSLDLHVGEIYVPQTGPNPPTGTPTPLKRYVLEPGATAVVTTLETLNIPTDIAAIGFPPSSISVQGILTTNPGHVDPGYRGKMHLTLINMGRGSFELRTGDIIITLLFFQLADHVGRGYQARKAAAAGTATPPVGLTGEQRFIAETLSYLAPDFFNYEARAKEVAQKAIEEQKDKLSRQVVVTQIVGVLGTIIVALLVGLSAYLNSHLEVRIKNLEDKVATQEKMNSLDKSVQEQISGLEKRIVTVEAMRSAPATNTNRQPGVQR